MSALFPTHTLTRRRPNVAGTRGALGAWTPASTTDIPITGTLQRPTARQIKTLAEADRTLDSYAFSSTIEMRTLDEPAGIEADILVINGEDYEVRRLQDDSDSPLPHYEAIAVRISEGKA